MPNISLLRQTFQSPIRSKIPNNNYIDIENALNDHQSQIDAILTPPTGSEVTNARDNHDVLRDRLRSASLFQSKYLIYGGVVTASSPAAMTVEVSAGEAIVNGIACKWAAQTSGVIPAPSENFSWYTVVVNSDNTISVVLGNESETPVLPGLSSSQKKLAHIFMSSGMTSITSGLIRSALYEPLAGYFQSGLLIGGISAWHKSITIESTDYPLVLTEEYKECDGTAIDDPESPLYRINTPDLNGGEFLKGAATSGTLEASTNKVHTHTASSGNPSADHSHTISAESNDHAHEAYVESILYNPGGYGLNAFSPTITANRQSIGANLVGHNHDNSGESVVHTHAITVENEGSTDSKPKNMSVVWVMRIK